MKGLYGLEVSRALRTCKMNGVSSFCQLPPTAANAFDALKSVATYPKETILFGEKQDPHGVYVLCHGEVKLSISSTEGRMLVMRVAKAGEILGLVSAVAGTPYESTAETLCPSQVAFVRRDDFLRFLSAWPQAIHAVAMQMSAQFQSVLMAKTAA